jgi:hypothetical protein
MLRQRNPGSSGDLTYRQANNQQDAEDDDQMSLLEVPTLQQAFHPPPPPSSACAYFCLVFSVLAIAFLSSLAVLLDNNSMYVLDMCASSVCVYASVYVYVSTELRTTRVHIYLSTSLCVNH